MALCAPSRYGKRDVVATVIAGIFLAYSLVGLFSIAPFYLPPALALLAAVMVEPETRLWNPSRKRRDLPTGSS